MKGIFLKKTSEQLPEKNASPENSVLPSKESTDSAISTPNPVTKPCKAKYKRQGMDEGITTIKLSKKSYRLITKAVLLYSYKRGERISVSRFVEEMAMKVLSEED